MVLSTPIRQPRGVPVDVTSFVGREHEVPAVKRLLADCRLVTLTGPGGVGKTRLALRTATEVQRGFRDGVWFVELAGLREGSLVPQTVAAALDLQGPAEFGPVDSLIEFVRTRQLLLVLDNCEHLVDSCASLAAALLRSCPELRILATSRQLLSVEGEHILSVPPLPAPSADVAGGADGLEQYASIRLFVDRARAVQPDFTVDADNRRAVAEICRRLDGIPLAIELAASRLRVLSVQQLHERLDDRYALLTGGSPAALPRQQTLRALIEWSFDLCSPAEQLLWARLFVFQDGFELDAVEAVCSDDTVPATEAFDVLAGLVDKSIVTTDRSSDRVRYLLPETLREFGRERLPERDEEVRRRRHRDWYQALVSRAATAWFTRDQVDLFNTLRHEHANLRGALGYCLSEPGETRVGLEMASALRFYWLMTGSLSEGRHWLDRLLEQHDARDVARLEALRVNGHVAALLNDHTAADALLGEARELAEELADHTEHANVTQACGLAALFQGDAERAVDLLGEALEQHRTLDDRGAMAYDAIQLALATVLLGDHDRALELIQSSLEICEPSGENWTTALALFALGVEACQKGDQELATNAGRQSIRLRTQLQDRRSVGLNFEALAWTAAASGDAVRAARLFGAAQAIQQSIGTSLRALGHLARLHEVYEPHAREALGDERFERERDAGMRLEYEKAVDYALGEDAETPRTTRPSATTPAAPLAGLTRREREVAALIARGMSNREIASALVISQRTAEGHVEHILAKLNFGSRAQVAAWIAQQTFPSN